MNNSDELQQLIKGAMKEIDDGAKIDRLKELHISMMETEISKMEIENIHNANKRYYGIKESISYYEDQIINEDKRGYSMGLQYLKGSIELIDIGKLTLRDILKYSDATLIAAKNLLGRYGLYYPECWVYIATKIDYLSSTDVENHYTKYISQVNTLSNVKAITEFEKRRLLLAGDYFHNRNQLILSIKNDKHEKQRKPHNPFNTYL